MGFPHATIDIPGDHLRLRSELESLVFHNELSAELLAGLHDGAAVPGHMCATAWVMDHQRSHILLVQHRLLGWSSPGGHMYPHESTRDGAIRELHEETGIDSSQIADVLGAPAIIHISDVPGDQPHRHWNVSWFFTVNRDVPLLPDHEATWWPCNALPDGPTDLVPTVNLLLTAGI